MSGYAASVGTFDGVHLGHRAILEQLAHEGARQGLKTKVLTFDRHPLAVLAPTRGPRLIQSRQLTAAQLRGAADEVVQLQFTPSLAALTARQFLEMARREHGVHTLVMGYDNTFGSDRLQSRQAYIEAGRQAGVRVVFAEAVLADDGTPVSSSAVRRALAAGDIDRAARMLGRRPVVEGVVVHGKRNGHRLGYPTLNIDATGYTPLRPGVYAGRLIGDDGHPTAPGVMNVGDNPTLGEGNPVTYEYHQPGQQLPELYGRHVTVQLLDYLRPEQKFESLDALRQAIAADIQACRKYT